MFEIAYICDQRNGNYYIIEIINNKSFKHGTFLENDFWADRDVRLSFISRTLHNFSIGFFQSMIEY